MKIAIIYLGRRGAGGPISLALGQALVGRDVQTRAFLSTDLESLPAWEAAGFPLLTVPTYSGALDAGASLLFTARIRRLAEQVRGWGPDVLVFPMFHPWNAVLQNFLAGVPALVFVHDPLPHAGLTGWLHARFEDASLRRAAGCFVLSRSLIPDLVRRGVPVEQIQAVRHGSLGYPGPGQNDRAQPLNLLFFGRITAYKGLEVLLQAFGQVQARHPDVNLVVAGEGSLAPYRRWLDGLKNVEIINRWLSEEEIPALFSRAALLVLPYTGATQSGVLSIAAEFSLPVIVTRAGGLPEQVRDGETGLLVAPGSVEELAAALERLLDDPALCRRLGTALQSDFELGRSWDEMAEKVVEMAGNLIPPVSPLLRNGKGGKEPKNEV